MPPVTLDGVAGVPWEVARRLRAWGGDPVRTGQFGKVLAVGTFNFGFPLGVRPVVVCEKWGGVVLPYPSPFNVEGLNYADLGRVRAALGVV